MFSEIASLALGIGPMETSGGGFEGPTVNEFFPDAIFFAGTPFEINRIMIARFIAVAAIVLIFGFGVRRLKVVPGRYQGVIEQAFSFVRVFIAEDLLGKADAKRFLPLLTSIFFTVFFMNITGIIPGLNIAGTSLVGVPLVLAIVSWVMFIYAGVRKHGGKFFVKSLFPPGVPKPLYILIAPIELLSTFVFRPATLALRLLMNMFVGHILLVLCFTATWYFLFNAESMWKLFGIGTFAFGLIFTLFEILVSVLQAYIFTLLTASYIQMSLAEEH